MDAPDYLVLTHYLILLANNQRSSLTWSLECRSRTCDKTSTAVMLCLGGVSVLVICWCFVALRYMLMVPFHRNNEQPSHVNAATLRNRPTSAHRRRPPKTGPRSAKFDAERMATRSDRLQFLSKERGSSTNPQKWSTKTEQEPTVSLLAMVFVKRTVLSKKPLKPTAPPLHPNPAAWHDLRPEFGHTTWSGCHGIRERIGCDSDEA